MDANGREFVRGVLAKNFDVANIRELFKARRSRLSRGVDRVDVDSFERHGFNALDGLADKMIGGTFKFSPYLEKLVSKGRGRNPRLIARATVRDKLVLWAMKDALHEILPGMVPSKLPNQVVREFVAYLAERAGHSVVRVDIESFYDTIDRGELLSLLNSAIGEVGFVQVIEGSIASPIVPAAYRKSEKSSYEQLAGVPQGLPTSNFLANVYMIPFDEKVSAEFRAYVRYVDDMVLIVPKDEAASTYNYIVDGLRKIGLSANRIKSKIYSYEDTFEFLGYEVSSGKVGPKRGSFDKFLRSVAALFNGLRRKALPNRRIFSDWDDKEFADLFIDELNELITGAVSKGRQYGWVFYFNESNDLTRFALVDSVVKRFSRRTDLLTNAQRSRIKRCVRAVHESRHSKGGGYVKNYDRIDSVGDKIKFLVRYAYLGRDEVVSAARVEEIYDSVLEQRLSRLERDVGFIS